MKSFIFTLILAFIFIGCSAKVQVSTMPDTVIDTSEDSLVFLSKSMYDIPLKFELKKVGFEVKKLPRLDNVSVTQGITQDVGNGTSVTKNVTKSSSEFTTRYGIEMEIGRASNWCLTNSAVYVPAFVEVVDLKTNETIFIVQGQGWTADCGYHPGDLFPKIADKLRTEWDKHKKIKVNTIEEEPSKKPEVKKQNKDTI